MRWVEIIEWVVIFVALVSLWPVAFKQSRPDWYQGYLIAILAAMAVVALSRIRRVRRALRDQRPK
ncbi:hypothetical protein AMK68_00895 [candidate division KD3-62 bacterium DG_56]|uniref:Uncharacterized protein n=1 Tax=candidate division KD3-62 bacterium DG_56 TaxID=1704032 RepID=A0A0S7XQB1_9BACT|nr:MAG: hypothetical protein AMK68_00895 [candidate division KD3-62 bacterium DG_56]